MIHANPDKRSRLRNASVHANEAATNLIVVPFSFSFFASRCRAQQDISKGGEGGYRNASLATASRLFLLSFFLSPLFPYSPFTREREREKEEEWEEDTIRYSPGVEN